MAVKKKTPVKKKAAPKKKVTTKAKAVTKPKQNRRGTPDFKPTKEQREMVQVLSASGFTQEQLCKLIPSYKNSVDHIDLKTLRKYFRDELDGGKVKAGARVAATLYNMAVSGRNVAATIFYCRTQLKYNTRVELTDPDGQPVGTGFGDLLKAALIKSGDLTQDEIDNLEDD